MNVNSSPVRLIAVLVLGATLLCMGGRFESVAAQQAVSYRVNAGGPSVATSPPWSADTAAAPSTFTNAAAAASSTYMTPSSVNTTHASIPAGTPAAVFSTERYDQAAGSPMTWNFPVTPGTYQVRLYFAEIWFATAGSRVFNVNIEGSPVLTNYDIVADVGAFTGVVKSFSVAADSSLDIAFGRVVENPKISAIEILQVSASPGQIGVAPSSVAFGSVQVGSSAQQSVQVTNLGAAGAPAINVFGASITGIDAGSFSENFTSAITLQPGQSTTISVTFAPTSSGSRSAALEILHGGTNSPLIVPLSGTGTTSSPNGTWQTLTPSGIARHEVSYVQVGGKFYLTGDRGILTNEVYDASTGTWATAQSLPEEFHHAQGVEFNGLIYYLGGLVGPYPDHVTPDVHIFNPSTNTWTEGKPMPVARARGGGGTALYNGKFYVAGGLRDDATGTGHEGTSVSMFDMYDPSNGTWTQLPSMPRARDHFHAAVVGTKLYAIGGRQGGEPDFFNAVIPQIDVFDLVAGTWSTLPTAANFPTPRGGSGTAVLGNEIVLIGGEGNGNAYNLVHAFNTSTNTWRALTPMPTARHGIQAALCNGGIYVAAGGLTQGGSAFTTAHQVLFLGAPTTCGSAPPPPPAGIVHRVNAGGPQVAGTPAWAADPQASPSAFTNAAAAGSSTFSVSTAIDMTHPSVPAGTPMSLFQSERYDPAAGAPMTWTFPVSPGVYEVRLHFAEIFHTTVGQRVFDVAIEGTVVLDDYDTVADVGPFKGVVKSFAVASDSALTIAFASVVDSPKVNAIEIRTGASPGALAVAPASLDFGLVVPNQASTKSIVLANMGSAGAPSIVVDATTISGANAAMFSDSFNDAGSITLAPGQSTALTVTFTPTSTGSKSATLQVAHSGSNSPTAIGLSGAGSTTSAIGFGKSQLANTATLAAPTSIQFGPDGKLYVGQQDGLIRVYQVSRTAANSYTTTATQTISSINTVPNHDDNGALNPSITNRLITGILVVGTAANPVIYVAHSDPRIGGGDTGADLNLDTNSSMISRLTWTGSIWQKLDLVRGLPRSEENHASNGMQLDPATNTLYVAMGGNTNKGATSNNFAFLPEFALSAAILSINLTAIGNTTYDLPTLDDESRPGTPDANDPFGGNDGKNQAKLVPGGPVQVYAPGFRNPYDLVIAQSGLMYTIDNGGNAGWGDVPVGEGPGGTCTNAPNEPGTTSPDSLHRITGPGYYGGHPNPTRANVANKFNATNPQSPVTVANAVECDYREPGAASGALAVFPASTNGLVEYTASNFGGAMNANLLTAGFDNIVYRIQLNATGTATTSVTPLFSNVGAVPLDLDALGPGTPFPGTIWVGDYWTGKIVVFEPNDYDSSAPVCTGANNPAIDEDNDGYDNQDEIQNATNPCSAADVPRDWDGDFTSDLNDPDDDNDGIADATDPFALDATNGTTKILPVEYFWENDGSNPGGILNLGFTGLMTNGSALWSSQYDPSKMTAGGAAGVLTVDQVAEGDAFGNINTQQYGFQFGVNAHPSQTDAFFVHTRILGPFNGLTPQDGQEMGLFIGTGNQDNYAKIVLSGTGGGRVLFMLESNGAPGGDITLPLTLPGPNAVDLYLRVDPDRATVQPFYTVTSGGVTGAPVMLAVPQPVPPGWFTSTATALAVGIISTSRGPAPVFPATWDFIRAVPATVLPTIGVSPSSIAFGTVAVGQNSTLPLQVINNGGPETANLTVDATTISGTHAAQFSDNFNDAGNATLAPGETASVSVAFAPTSTGNKTATLSVAHSGSNPLAVSLTGTGGTTTQPTLGATPSSVAFGSVAMGQSSAIAVRLTNLGTTSLIVDATTITGTQAAQFADDFNDAANVTLNAGAETTVTVTFTPSSTGDKTASLSIAHNGGNSPLVVPLSGTGASVPVNTALYRVNAGGLAISGSPTWTADAPTASTFTNAAAAASAHYTTPSAVSTSHASIPVGTPASLFQSERYDTPPGAPMQWSFPVSPGSYEVRLYFAEIYFTTPGARIFDVSIEGATVLNDYDIVADVGPFAGVMKPFVVNADSSLDILLGRVVENPKVSGIEIIPLAPGPGTLTAAPTSHDFGQVVVGQTGGLTVQLTNTGGSSLLVQSTAISGTHAGQFSDNFNDGVHVSLSPGASTTLAVTFTPTSTGGKTASLAVTHSGANTPLVITLAGSGVTAPSSGTPLFRVNAGGGSISGTPDWTADTSGTPSTFTNGSAAGSSTFVTASSISLTHASVPAGTPMALFQSERYDQPTGAEMQWSFPVTAGTYEVRLYFAEVYFTSPGARVFDISIEGVLRLDNYDIVADAGPFRGVVKSFTVTSDANLQIILSRVIENPKISAIEIIPVSGSGS